MRTKLSFFVAITWKSKRGKVKSTAIVEKCCMPSLIANKRLVVIRMPPFRIYVFISFVSFLDEISISRRG